MVAPHSTDPDSRARKAAMRRLVATRPTRLDGHALEALRANVVALVDRSMARRVALFWPLGDEPDLRPLFPGFAARGLDVLLPRIDAPDAPLSFVRWRDGAALLAGPHGTCHPPGVARRPDLVMLPLLAFDRAGRRLGRGGGYYDRTLAALRPVFAAGIGAAAREVASVPVEPHDVPLAAIVTEAEILDFGSGPAIAPGRQRRPGSPPPAC